MGVLPDDGTVSIARRTLEMVDAFSDHPFVFPQIRYAQAEGVLFPGGIHPPG